MTNPTAAQGHPHPSIKLYLGIFAALMVLTVVTVMASWIHLPVVPAILLGMAIATVKAGLVAAFFMHLKSEAELIYGVLTVTFLFMAVLFAIPIADSLATADKVQSHLELAAPAPEGKGH